MKGHALSKCADRDVGTGQCELHKNGGRMEQGGQQMQTHGRKKAEQSVGGSKRVER